MATSAAVRMRYEELLFYAACVCNCWSVCLCVCVCLEHRGGCRGGTRKGGAGGGGGGGGSMRVGSSWRWQLSRAMRLALRWCRLCRPGRGGGGRGPGGAKPWSSVLWERWSYGKLLLRSLCFNSLSDSDTLLDCVFEPVYWIVDNVTRWFGVVFVTLVVLLTCSVCVIVYLFVLPTMLNTYPVQWIAWHLCYGHWLLVMVVFHYYKATTTSAGHPPKKDVYLTTEDSKQNEMQMEKADVPSVSICKKCIIPKPARTHHCSICSTCILKMDHHCPWLNNCVGHFNHRYFFSFCLYMTMGCLYCSVSSRDMFLEAYSAVEHYMRVQAAEAGLQGDVVTGLGVIISLMQTENVTGEVAQSYYQTPPPPFTFRETTSHKSIIFLWVLTSSVTVALGGLTLWHAILITKGETSVERHINRKEARRLREQGKGFRNPYHHGNMNNWKILLGVEKSSHWLTRVLLPSCHPPQGDGIVWDSVYYRKDPLAI